MDAYIRHISYYLPHKKLTNEDLEKIFPKITSTGLFKITGIRERSVAEIGELSSDMAVKAAENLFAETNINRSEIDFLIFCTQSPDYFTPTTACLIQNRLNLSNNIGALDINLGCTGFLYGLNLASGLIKTNSAKNILLLNAEEIVNNIHPQDKSSRILFGDAATATLISGGDKPSLSSFIFGTDGNKGDIMMMKAGGFRHPIKQADLSEFKDEFGNISSAAHFYMKGDDVLAFAIDVVPKVVENLLRQENLKINDIDFFIFHQANLYMLKLLRKIIEIPEEKFCVNLAHTGNTVSCTIPIALSNAIESGKAVKGNKVMLVAFGVGVSWAATILTIE